MWIIGGKFDACVTVHRKHPRFALHTLVHPGWFASFTITPNHLLVVCTNPNDENNVCMCKALIYNRSYSENGSLINGIYGFDMFFAYIFGAPCLLWIFMPSNGPYGQPNHLVYIVECEWARKHRSHIWCSVLLVKIDVFVWVLCKTYHKLNFSPERENKKPAEKWEPQ